MSALPLVVAWTRAERAPSARRCAHTRLNDAQKADDVDVRRHIDACASSSARPSRIETPTQGDDESLRIARERRRVHDGDDALSNDDDDSRVVSQVHRRGRR